MKKKQAEKLVVATAGVAEKLKAHAADAFRELWDRTVDNATLDPRSRLVTPDAVREAIRVRLREVVPVGELIPEVRVSLNHARTGFDIELRPADAPFVLPPVR